MAPEIDKATLVRSEKQKLKGADHFPVIRAHLLHRLRRRRWRRTHGRSLWPGLALLLMVITPLVFSIPNMLMVREMQSMMPVEGGYYHWVKQAFGPFIGFMSGWMNWVVRGWMYPSTRCGTAWYLSSIIPALSDGATIGGIHFSSDLFLAGISRAHHHHFSFETSRRQALSVSPPVGWAWR